MSTNAFSKMRVRPEELGRWLIESEERIKWIGIEFKKIDAEREKSRKLTLDLLATGVTQHEIDDYVRCRWTSEDADNSRNRLAMEETYSKYLEKMLAIRTEKQ